MNKILSLLLCSFCFLSSPIIANEDLLQLFHLAVENGDVKLIKDVIDALLKDQNSSKHLLDALAKYSEKGKIDFALHNAIKDKNLLASVVLAHHSKDINIRSSSGGGFYWKTATVGSILCESTSPLEIALEADIIEIIPYLLMKKADPYFACRHHMVLENELDLNYLISRGITSAKMICAKTGKVYISHTCSRTFVGNVIAKNRLDVIKILSKMSLLPLDLNKICYTVYGDEFTPLQYALLLKRYEIAQFLIDHGAKIQ